MHPSFPSHSDPKDGLSNRIRWPFIILAVFLIFAGAFWSYYPRNLSFSVPPAPVPTPEVTETSILWYLPDRISIPSLDINLPIIPSRIVNNDWETSSTGVSFLNGSALIGQPGNSIFYGHNWPRLLGKLKQVKVGENIIVSASDSAETVFTIVDVKIVDPTDVSILQPYPDPTLTLYTCTGVLDSKRLVVIATPNKTE